jgi:serine dehydrogenase proteinase
MGLEQRKAIIEQIQTKRGSRVICCLTSDRENAQGLIAKDFLFRFFQHLRAMPETKNGKLEKLDVLWFTLGGDTMAAYSLARLVRQFAKTVGVLVPYMCLSGGTLFALGADDIVMTRLGLLSSIDPSISGPWNPSPDVTPTPPGNIAFPGQKPPVAVESVAGFKKLVCEEWRLDEEGTANAFNLLATKVNPLLLGDLQRAKEQIVRLATSLMKQHFKDTERIANIVGTLASGLGSHDYLIGAVEAREDIKLHVAPENPELEELILKLYEDFAEEMELGIPFNAVMEMQMAVQQQQPRPGQPAAVPAAIPSKVAKIVVIESAGKTNVWEREFAVVAPGQIQVRRNHWRR